MSQETTTITDIGTEKKIDTSMKKIAIGITQVQAEGKVRKTGLVELGTQDLIAGISTGTHPGIAIGMVLGMTEDQTEAPAGTEGEVMVLQGLNFMTMGRPEDPEGVVRRPIVWWGLL